jgi:hypothetical protein
VVVRRKGGRLDDESVLPADVFENLDPDFLIGEAPDMGAAQRHVEMRRDRLRKRPVRIARQKFHRAHAPFPAPADRGVLAATGAANNMTRPPTRAISQLRLRRRRILL